MTQRPTLLNLRGILVLLVGFMVLMSTHSLAIDDENGAPTETFDAYLSTTIDGSEAKLNVKVGPVDLNSPGDFLGPFQREDGTSILPKDVNVVIVQPKDTPAERSAEVAEAARRAIANRFPGAKVTTTNSYMDSTAHKRHMDEQRGEIAQLLKSLPRDTARELLLQMADEMAAESKKDVQAWEGNWLKRVGSKLKHPYNRVVGARIIALTKIGVSYTVVLSKYGLNLGSLLVGAIQGGFSAFLGYNNVWWSDLCASHSIPGIPTGQIVPGQPIRNTLKTVSNYTLKPTWDLIRYPYNRWAPGEVKAAALDLVRAFFIDFCVRLAAWGTNQQILDRETGEYKTVAAPWDGSFLAQAGLYNLMEMAGDSAMNVGTRRSELKGHYTVLTRSYLIWILGLIDTAWKSYLRTGGSPAITFALVTTSTVGKFGVYAVSFLPARGPQITLISRDISEDIGFREERNVAWYDVIGIFGNMINSAKLQIMNSLHGRYSESDRNMTLWAVGGKLEESLNLQLSDEQLDKFRNDPNLEKEVFVQWLNLKKLKPNQIDALWKYRTDHLGEATLTPGSMCGAALTKGYGRSWLGYLTSWIPGLGKK